jgi:hypothetical protein
MLCGPGHIGPSTFDIIYVGRGVWLDHFLYILFIYLFILGLYLNALLKNYLDISIIIQFLIDF